MNLRHRGAVSVLAITFWAVPAVPVCVAATTPPPAPAGTTSPAVPRPTSTVGGAGLLQPGVLVSRRTGVPVPPNLTADSYVVADLTDGRVILAKNAHQQGLPASTLKTLTALTLAPVLDPTTLVRATPEDANIDGSKVGVLPGSQYSVRDLMYGLMLTSGNDAANALARANGGIPHTARQMTAYAHRLGALDTEARNPSGLDAPGQLTSAYDLALIGRAAVEDPDVAPYLRTKTAKFPGKRVRGPGGGRAVYEINNHNKLLWNYDGTVGVKNGYTIKARQTYIGAVRRGKAAYVITYMGGSVDWRQAAAVMDWAFTHGKTVRPVGELVRPEQVSTPSATSTNETEAAPPTAAAGLPAQLGSDTGRNALVLGGVAVLVLGAGGVLVSRLRRR